MAAILRFIRGADVALCVPALVDRGAAVCGRGTLGLAVLRLTAVLLVALGAAVVVLISLLVDETVLDLLLLLLLMSIVEIILIALEAILLTLVHEEEVLARAVRVVPVHVHVRHLLQVRLVLVSLRHASEHWGIRDVRCIDAG